MSGGLIVPLTGQPCRELVVGLTLRVRMPLDFARRYGLAAISPSGLDSNECRNGGLAVPGATGQDRIVAAAATGGGLYARSLTGWHRNGVQAERAFLLWAAGFDPAETNAVADLPDRDLHALAAVRAAS